MPLGPVGSSPGLLAVTVAVKVTGLPATGGLGDTDNVVVDESVYWAEEV